MNIKVYKGTHEIGGTCIELTANNGKVLWIDIGAPLNDVNSNTDYVFEGTPDAILISHPHKDHFGLLENIPLTTPVYIGECSLNLIQAVTIFTKQKPYCHNFSTYKTWKEFTIADTFTIYPYLTDHSSAEAFAFTIECDGKKIFYSGDFRAGGAKQKVFHNLCKRPPQNIDLMFVEGTTIERTKALYPDEKSVEKKFIEFFKSQENSSFVVGSGQNVDRIVALYRACLQSNKTLIIDPYIAYILKIVGKNSPKLPQAHWEKIKVYNDPRQLELLKNAGELELIEKIKENDCKFEAYKNPTNYVYYLRHIKQKLIDHIRKTNSASINIIYSQWTGYLQEENYISSSENILRLKEQDYINFYEIHASGHASREEVLQLVKSINAKKTVPIHTNNPALMQEYLTENNISTIELWEDHKKYLL